MYILLYITWSLFLNSIYRFISASEFHINLTNPLFPIYIFLVHVCQSNGTIITQSTDISNGSLTIRSRSSLAVYLIELTKPITQENPDYIR